MIKTKIFQCDSRLLTRFSNRALVIGSSATLTLGLGMVGIAPAAFATETTIPPTDEISSQQSDAAPTSVPDPTPSVTATPVAPTTETPATPAPAEPSDPAFTVKDVADSEIPQLECGDFGSKSMYGDALGKLSVDKDYTTQHDDTLKVDSGDTLDIKSNLDVTVGLQALENWQEKVKRVKVENLTYGEADSNFQTIILVPEYLEMPSDPQSYKLEPQGGNKPLYRIVSVLRSEKRLAITLALNEFYKTGDSKKGAYSRLKDGFKVYANKPLGLVISGVKVKDHVASENQATLEFRTTGYLSIGGFSSTNRREKARYFGGFMGGLSRSWYTLQGQEEGNLIGNGTDSTRPQSQGISLTMDIKPKPAPADPEDSNPNPNSPVTPDTPSVDPDPIPGGAVVPPNEPEPPVAGVVTTPTEPQPPVAGVVTTPTEPQPPVAGVVATPTEPQPPVAGVFTPAAPQPPTVQSPHKALATTGSSAETLAGGAMILFLAGGAMMVASRRRARR